MECYKELSASLKVCEETLNQLFSASHSTYAWPFYRPVDVSMSCFHDYCEIIKKPMDLSIVKKKLDYREYNTPNEFKADVELIFSNCYQYNHRDNIIVKMARKLQDVFQKSLVENAKGMTVLQEQMARKRKAPATLSSATSIGIGIQKKLAQASPVDEADKILKKIKLEPMDTPAEAPLVFVPNARLTLNVKGELVLDEASLEMTPVPQKPSFLASAYNDMSENYMLKKIKFEVDAGPVKPVISKDVQQKTISSAVLKPEKVMPAIITKSRPTPITTVAYTPKSKDRVTDSRTKGQDTSKYVKVSVPHKKVVVVVV